MGPHWVNRGTNLGYIGHITKMSTRSINGKKLESPEPKGI